MGNYCKCWVCGGAINESIADKLKTPIEKLGLSARSINCLRRGNIKTVKQLIRLNQEHLLRLRNLGTACLYEIIEKVRLFGFDIEQ